MKQTQKTQLHGVRKESLVGWSRVAKRIKKKKHAGFGPRPNNKRGSNIIEVASLGSVFSSPRSEEPCIGLQSGSGLVDMDQDPRTIREQQVSLERDVLVSPEGENGVGDPHGALSWLDGGQERLRRGSEGPMSASRSSSSAPLTMPRNDGEEVEIEN
ncbi:hypothetical protein HN51_041371 [Arachis hypogaea]